MTDRPPQDDAGEAHWPEARRIRRRWPGLIWAIPLAAVLIVAYLGVQALFNRGVTVTLSVSSGSGITPGDTKVIENGVEVGHVTHVRTTEDGKRVELTLSMDRGAKAQLTSAARFWLIGAQPSITDLASVRAAIAGITVGFAPAPGGQPQRAFTALDQQPQVMPGTAGRGFILESDHLGTLQPGAGIIYQGQKIGVVTQTALKRVDDFQMGVFVYAPYDGLVRPGALFWRGSPIKLALSGSGVSAQLSSPASVLQGSIQFDLPKSARGGAESVPGTAFPLYDEEEGARNGPTGPEQLYYLALSGAAGDLQDGAPVSLLAHKIGEVRHAQLVFAPGTRTPYTAATIAIYPKRLDVVLPAAADATTWRGATDAALDRLLQQGYRATLSQSIPLVGAHAIALEKGTGGAAALLATGAHPQIPTAASQGDVNALVAKLNRVPVEEIGDNVRRLTGNLARITGSPEVSDGLHHLDRTLQQVDSITAQVKPEIGPLMAKLNQTATELQATAAAARGTLGGGGANQDASLSDAIRQLTEAARSIRSLTDYLGRHPEAILRGKGGKKETK